MFKINLVKELRGGQKAKSTDGAKKEKPKSRPAVLILIAALVAVFAWAYFKGGVQEKLVTVIKLEKEKPPPPPVTPRKSPPAQTQQAGQVVEEKKMPGPKPAEKPKAGSQQASLAKEEKSEVGPTPAETVKQKPPPASPPAEKEKPLKLPDNRTPVVLHLASFKSEEVAAKTVNILAKKGYHAFMAVYDTPNQGKWFRVYSGRYGTVAEAEAAAVKLKNSDLTKYAKPNKLPYALQVGVYGTRGKAAKRQDRLDLLGYPSAIIQARGNDGNLYYRLLVGAYKSGGDSTKMAKKLKTDGYPTVLVAP